MMPPVVSALLAFVGSLFRSRVSLHLEHLALWHQLAVYQHTVHRPRLHSTDRLFWAWLSRLWPGWEGALTFVQPRTVITWQQQRFRDHWRRLSQHGKPGRPAVAKEVRQLVRDMWQANPTWGSPRIVGELRKLGIEVAKSTVEKYRMRPPKQPSPTWKTFLANHVQDLVALDFFVVPTVRHTVLFVLVILAHARRRVVHFNITKHPTAQWTTQRVVDAFPWDEAPRYLLRDRDRIYGGTFRQRVRHMGIKEVLIAPRSPWQHPSRVPGPCGRPTRAASAAAPDSVLPTLSSLAHASGVGHGLSGATAGPTARSWPDQGSARGGWVASPL
jgi:putative transposase